MSRFPFAITCRIGSLEPVIRQANLHLVIFSQDPAMARIAGQNAYFQNHFRVEENYILNVAEKMKKIQSIRNHAFAKWHVICTVPVSAAVRPQGAPMDR